jgi:hypothetical protein
VLLDSDHVSWGASPSVCSRATARLRGQGRRPQPKCGPREQRRRLQRDYASAGAVRLQNQLAAAATRRASTIRLLPWQPARHSKKSPLHARALARTMSAPRLPGTSGPAASKSAMESSMPQSRPGRGNASPSEAGIKKSVGRRRKEPVDVFASLRCNVNRASPSATHEVSSSVVRVAGTPHGDRWLESIFLRRRLIQTRSHSDRSGAGRRAAGETGECRWIGGDADDDHSQRNPPPCLPAPPSSLPSGALSGA